MSIHLSSPPCKRTLSAGSFSLAESQTSICRPSKAHFGPLVFKLQVLETLPGWINIFLLQFLNDILIFLSALLLTYEVFFIRPKK